MYIEEMKTNNSYCKTQPCKTCPYRRDVPLRHWSVQEFRDLIASEISVMGVLYGCHTKDGSICIGWLIDQDKRRFPSIMLRVSLSKNNITREYLDKLNSPHPLFDSVEQMCYANYPEEFPKPVKGKRQNFFGL